MHLPILPAASRRRSLRIRPPAATPGGRAATPAEPAAALHRRALLTHPDLLWSTSPEDGEGLVSLALLACPDRNIGVLVADTERALGLKLSRSDAQDLHRALVTWLAHTSGTVST